MVRMLNRRVGSLAALAVGFGIAGSASAITTQTWSSASGLNVGITDDGYDGTLGSMNSHAIAVGFMPDFITDVNVKIAMSHSFVGDLTLKLKSPSGTIVTLLNRPGLLTSDEGVDTGGDASNLSISFPVIYDDQAPSGISAELMGDGITSNSNVGDPAAVLLFPGADNPNNFYPDADGAVGDKLASYNGESAPGAWTLYLGDSSLEATGILDSWELTITTAPRGNGVPEPTVAALGMLSLAGLAGAATRRRRKA